MAFCTGCGKELKEGVRFCTACGKPVPTASGAAPTAVPRPTPQPPQKQKSKALPILIAALIVVLLAAAAVWWFVLRDTNADADDDDERGEKTEQTDTDKKRAAADVTLENKYEGSEEYAVITGYSADDEELWTVKTDRHESAQLPSVQEIGLYYDKYYYIEDGDVVALDLADGSELWRNDDFEGALGDFVFDEDGALYLCGFLGPDIFIIDQNGKTIDFRDQLKENYYWAYDIRFTDEGDLRITFEQIGEGGGEGTITLDPETLSILAVTGEDSEQSETAYDIPRTISLSASSTLQEAGHDHSPYLATDGDLATAWVEGASGAGVGEWLRLDLGSDTHVSAMQLWAGYQKSETLFYKNGRPARVRVTFSDGRSIEADLNDAMGMQTINFGGERVTSSITITILSVYPGSTYADTCISEITLS